MTTFVVPLDGSELAERALRPACAFATRVESSKVLLVTCGNRRSGATVAYLDDRASLFRDVTDIDTQVIDEKPAVGLLEVAAAAPDAIICMATHGRGGLRETVLGSIATELVCSVSGPLMLVGRGFRGAPLPGEIGRMVVCTDGSDHADSIAPHAARWAHQMDLGPWVVKVVQPNEQVPTGDEPIRDLEGDAAIEQMKRISEYLAHRRRDPKMQVLHGADPGLSVATFAANLPASLIALATHGRSGLSRLAMGSVAAKVVRNATCPVLAVRPEPR